VKLHEIACARSGDKGDVSNVCVFPYDEDNFPALRDALTVEVVAGHFGDLVRGTITRYEFTGMHGLNFVMLKALAGGVSMSLRTDIHGKALASLMLDLDLLPELVLPVPRHATV
jgi:hypothetical protein